MAWTYSGTSTDYLDLLADLKAALEAAGWTIERWTGGNELIVRGPGAGSRSDFYLGFAATTNSSTYWNLHCFSLTGYLAGSAFTAQPGYSTSAASTLNAWNSSIGYWISINDDRFILVAKVSTKYQWLGGGLVKVYGTDTQYGYPVFTFGGSYVNDNTDPYTTTVNFFQVSLRLPGGSVSALGVLDAPPTTVLTVDSAYPLWPSYIFGSGSLYGEIEHLHRFPGVTGTNAEDTITVGSDVYWVFPNSGAVSFGDFLALKET
jgi:hypothetical protein